MKKRIWIISGIIALLATMTGMILFLALSSDEPIEARGRWRKTRSPQDEESESGFQEELRKQLEAIGYMSGSVEAGKEAGITKHAPGEAMAGLNFYISGHFPGAFLMDMNGTILHSWKKAFVDLWPDDYDSGASEADFWRKAHLFENGDVLGIFEGYGIVKLDKHSNVIWKAYRRAHHDLEIRPNGDIWVLTRHTKIIRKISPTKPILDDYVAILDKNGNLKIEYSTIDAFHNSVDQGRVWNDKISKTGDIFHTNTLHYLDGRLEDRIPEFREGNVLVSWLHLSTIGVFDLDQEAIVWTFRGPFRKQHDPKILANGNLLLFNNRKTRKRSSVMEFDPVTKELIWEYQGTEEEPFFSQTCGTAERLPNGNTLIVESDNGRAFEVTRDKRIVWEFRNPSRAGEDDNYVATLFDLIRLPQGFPTGWLDE